MACADDNTYTCGGNNSIEVYKTTKEIASTTSTSTSSAPAASATVDLASTKLVSSKWTCTYHSFPPFLLSPLTPFSRLS